MMVFKRIVMVAQVNYVNHRTLPFSREERGDLRKNCVKRGIIKDATKRG